MRLSTLIVRRVGQGSGGEVAEQLRPAPNGDVPMTPYEARRLAAQLTAAADKLDPPPVRSPHGPGPYGWEYVKGLWVVNLREAEGVDVITDCYLTGYSLSATADRLNQLGYPTKAGKQWTFATVQAALKTMVRRGAITPAERGPLTVSIGNPSNRRPRPGEGRANRDEPLELELSS